MRGTPRGGGKLGKLGKEGILQDWGPHIPVPVRLGTAVEREARAAQRSLAPFLAGLRAAERGRLTADVLILPGPFLTGPAVKELREACRLMAEARTLAERWGRARYVAWALDAAEPTWSRTHQRLGDDLAALRRAVESVEEFRRAQRSRDRAVRRQTEQQCHAETEETQP